MNRPEAFLILGERHTRSVCLEFGHAIDEASKHHGVWLELMRTDAVAELLQVANAQGYENGYAQGRKDEHDHPA